MIMPIITLAYIDPGTGAFLLQTLMAGVLGAVFYFRSAVKRLGSWIFKGKNRRAEHASHIEEKNKENRL